MTTEAKQYEQENQTNNISRNSYLKYAESIAILHVRNSPKIDCLNMPDIQIQIPALYLCHTSRQPHASGQLEGREIAITQKNHFISV